MHVLFMAQCYAPESVSAAVLITELATGLVRHGHRVTMVTGAPNYPDGHVFEGYGNKLYAVEDLDGVRVIRTWSYISPSRKFWPRILHYGTFSVSAFYGGLFAGKPDVLVSFSPTLPLGLSAWLLSWLWHVPWVLQLEDLYPDAAINTGVLSNKRIIVFFLAMERFLYRNATHISVIAETFRRMLLAKGVAGTKLEVIPVWANPDEVRPMSKHNTFRHRNELGEKFVVLYAGNIGLTSCLEDVLDAADILRKQSDIQFVVVGEGIKKQALVSDADARDLRNIRFLSYQPREILPEMLAAADLNLVTLAPSAAFSSLPSKLFSAMASMRPILAVAPLESEIAHIVREARCGLVVAPASPKKLARAILDIKTQASRLASMGENGRAFFEKYHTRDHCIDAYETMLLRLIQHAQSKKPYTREMA